LLFVFWYGPEIRYRINLFSIIAKCSPLSPCFTFKNSQKSHGAISSEYGGCGIMGIFYQLKIAELQKMSDTVHCRDAKTNLLPICLAISMN